jgi:hypothetical protein
MSVSRSFWKFCAKRRLPKNVTLKKKVHFDKATNLGGYNVIGAHTNIAGAKIGRHTYIANNCALQCCRSRKLLQHCRPRCSAGLYASFEYIRVDFTGVLQHSQADEFFLCG